MFATMPKLVVGSSSGERRFLYNHLNRARFGRKRARPEGLDARPSLFDTGETGDQGLKCGFFAPRQGLGEFRGIDVPDDLRGA